MDYCSNFRHDLEVGQLAEKALADIFENSTIEVKNDLKASKTGNLFIEYMSRGKPSGIGTTKAQWYAFIVEDRIVILPTEKLKLIARKYFNTKRDVLGGDSNSSKGILVPFKELIEV